MSGFVVIHRSIVGHPAFRDAIEEAAFVWMVVRAAWRPTRVKYKSRLVDLARGELAVTTRDLASRYGWSEPSARRFLSRLKSENMIDARTDAGVTVVSLCNYDKFQAIPSKGDAVRDAADGAEGDALPDAPPDAPVDAPSEAVSHSKKTDLLRNPERSDAPVDAKVTQARRTEQLKKQVNKVSGGGAREGGPSTLSQSGPAPDTTTAETARAILRHWSDEITRLWGGDPSPRSSTNALEVAKCWVREGVPLDLAQSVITDGLERKREGGQGPPGSPAYVRRSMADALATRNAPPTPPTATRGSRHAAACRQHPDAAAEDARRRAERRARLGLSPGPDDVADPRTAARDADASRVVDGAYRDITGPGAR